MKQKEFKEQICSNNIKKEGEMGKHSVDEYFIYGTVGALTAKFLEVILKISVGEYWYASLIIGAIIGIIFLKREEIF